jgi:hypothetical protein
MKKNMFGSVFVLLIFCLFAFGVFVTIMLSASTYQAQNETTTTGQSERIILSYVRTKIREADALNAVSVGSHHGINTLIISETLGGREYVTYVYHYDGWVREIFFEYGLEFLPGDGIAVMAAGSLWFEELQNGLLRVVTETGKMYISPRGGVDKTGGDFYGA